MFGIQILAFIFFICILATKFKARFSEVLPLGVGFLVLFLYILSFFRGLNLIDYAEVGFLFVILIQLGRKHGINARKYLMPLRDLDAICVLLLMAVVSVCVYQKKVTWWDDYNFWATDVKSLYYLGGFARKYQNVASEFGDYPPGTQMFKWWFAHMDTRGFKEGLMFAGYYCFNLAFLAPLLKYVRLKKWWTTIPATAFLWLMPTCLEIFWVDGCCADFSMAVVFGAFLVSVLDDKVPKPLYITKQIVYLSVLSLCKNTGGIWLIFGILFTLLYQLTNKPKVLLQRKEKLLVAGIPLGVWGSWLLFCLLMRRVAKLTGTMVHMATGSMAIPAGKGELVKVFAEAFALWPLHRYHTLLLDMSPLLFLTGIFAFWIILFTRKRIPKRFFRFVLIFEGMTALVFYSINLISHLTIFATENQYSEPFAMVSSIARYGAPFTVGSLCIMIYALFTYGESKWGTLIFLALMLLTADYKSAYRGLIGYNNTESYAPEQVLAGREEIVDEKARDFLLTVNGEPKGNGASQYFSLRQQAPLERVLYIRDYDDISWVRNAYMNFEGAPVSIVYGWINSEITREQIVQMMEEAHAALVYIEPLTGESDLPYDELCTKQDLMEN